MIMLKLFYFGSIILYTQVDRIVVERFLFLYSTEKELVKHPGSFEKETG